jgi:hypothetical protein
MSESNCSPHARDAAICGEGNAGMYRGEPTIDELLSDPMMVPVLQHSRISERELRDLLAQVAARLARPAPRPDATEPSPAG